MSLVDDIFIILPEITLVSLTCIVLLVDVIRKDITLTCCVAVLALLITLGQLVAFFPKETNLVFFDTFVSDPVGSYLKIFVCLSSIVALVYAYYGYQTSETKSSEYFLLSLFAVIGMLFLISASNLLTVYLGLELLSLSLYAMVAMDKNSNLAAEAAMKYFVLGALASGVLLFGMSMLYGASGSLSLESIGVNTSVGDGKDLVQIFGLVFILVAIGFKLGVVPFHMWVPDVYQGARTPVALFLSAAPKIAAFAMAFRLLAKGLAEFSNDWTLMIIVLAVSSLALGNIVAIAQVNYKRMLAYSTIAHMGFLVIGLVSASSGGYAASIFYVSVYSLMGMAAFAALLLLPNSEAASIERFKGLAKSNPLFSFFILILMFSMAGIPPFAGFWAKWFVLKEVIAAGYLWLAVYAVFCSLIGAFYYLRIIKFMYFDEPKNDDFNTLENSAASILFNLNCLSILMLGLFPGLLMAFCTKMILMSGF